MGLISKEAEVMLTGSNIEYYENLKYKIPRKIDNRGRLSVARGIKILVNINDLPNKSHALVDIECDNCGKELTDIKWSNYKRYVKDDGKYYCQKCSTKLFPKKLKYKYNIGNIVETKTGKLQILQRIRLNYKCKPVGYKYKCLTCGNVDVISQWKLISLAGCNVCCIPSQKILKRYNDLWTTHPEVAKLLECPSRGFEISKGTSKKEKFKCLICNNVENKSVYNVIKQGFSCSKCSDGISFPNKFMFNLLDQLQINFIPEYSPDWISPKRYDFYFELDNKWYIVEMDGGLGHKNGNPLNGQTAEETQGIDDYKDKKAKEYNIEVIRIDCTKSELEYLKNNILNSRLVDIFNLSLIDWLKCYKYSCNNFVQKICQLWNEGLQNSNEIAKQAHLSRSTIIKYLKQGTKLGWCNYNPKTAMIKCGKGQGKKRNKKIICLTTKEIFNSMAEAEYKYNIFTSNLVKCCKGEYKSTGKHPITGEKLRWMYYEDYIKEQK